MVKLLDSYQAGDSFVATIFADAKTDVPETAEALEALLPDVGAPLSCGTLIITSTFDVAFVRSDGLIQWKGEEPPTPPAEPVTVTLDATGGRLVAQYVNPTDGTITEKEVSNTTDTISVAEGTTITVFSGEMASSGSITTTAENVLVGSSGDGAEIYLVLISGDTTVAYSMV